MDWIEVLKRHTILHRLYGKGDQRTVPPYCVAAAAATEHCCEKGLGIVYYVSRSSKTKLSVRRATYTPVPELYHKIPHLVYVHKRWSEEDRAEWMTLSRSDRLERLNARAQLWSRVLVMPITLSYTGRRFDSTTDTTKADEAVEINGYLDGNTGPLVALCIPDKAYLGWVADMIPLMDQWEDVREAYRRASGDNNLRPTPVWKVLGKRREDAEMRDWDALLDRLYSMYQERRLGSVVFFSTVLRWYSAGGRAVRELRKDPSPQDEQEEEEEGDVEIAQDQ